MYRRCFNRLSIFYACTNSRLVNGRGVSVSLRRIPHLAGLSLPDETAARSETAAQWRKTSTQHQNSPVHVVVVVADAELGIVATFNNSERILLECFMCMLIVSVDPSAADINKH